MKELSIKVDIAGRTYPLSINWEEEANVRKASKDINESIARLKEGYPLTEKQDLLAMAALEVSTRVMNSTDAEAQKAIGVELSKLEALLTPDNSTG